jgi:Circularly permutated YpsA SLOG family
MVRLLTILSGGQAGVDRGALDAALELGNPCGGWCPKGRAAEDGPIPSRYPLHQVDGGYANRTRRNVAESDGTLVLYRGALTEGTQLTLDACRELGKPVCLVDADVSSPAMAAIAARRFIDEHGIEKLNVAGPRESRWTHAHDYAFDAVHALILMVWHDGQPAGEA